MKDEEGDAASSMHELRVRTYTCTRNRFVRRSPMSRDCDDYDDEENQRRAISSSSLSGRCTQRCRDRSPPQVNGILFLLVVWPERYILLASARSGKLFREYANMRMRSTTRLADQKGWGSKFGTTKCRTTDILKFQNCEYENNERWVIFLFTNLFFHFLK